jgi:hypothetical protein
MWIAGGLRCPFFVERAKHDTSLDDLGANWPHPVSREGSTTNVHDHSITTLLMLLDFEVGDKEGKGGTN